MEPKGEHNPSGCKFGATKGTNIDIDREDSRIGDTQNRMTASIVYRIIHRRASGELMSMCNIPKNKLFLRMKFLRNLFLFLVNLKLENYCHLRKFRILNLVNCK